MLSIIHNKLPFKKDLIVLDEFFTVQKPQHVKLSDADCFVGDGVTIDDVVTGDDRGGGIDERTSD